MGDPDIWKQTLLSWMALQEELECRRHQGHKRKREEDEEEEESVTGADGSTHTVSSSTHLIERQKEVGKDSRQHTPSFRVSCRCSGVIARSNNSQVHYNSFYILFKKH